MQSYRGQKVSEGLRRYHRKQTSCSPQSRLNLNNNFLVSKDSTIDSTLLHSSHKVKNPLMIITRRRAVKADIKCLLIVCFSTQTHLNSKPILPMGLAISTI